MLTAIVWVLYAAVLFISFFLLIVLLEHGGIKKPVEWLDEWPKLTLIIPAYNEEETIQMTIESILAADYPSDKLNIIVVNDGSQDETAEKVEPYTDRVDLINQENQGKGAALNTGLDKVETELFGCVDADSRLKDDSLKNIVSELEEGSGGIASAMKVYQPQNMLQKLQWVEYLMGIFLRNIMSFIDSIHVTPGPLSIYRTEPVKELGGFDEDSIVEDQEICFKLQNNGWDISHSRRGEVFTVAPETVREFYDQRYRWYKGALQNIVKYKHMIFNREYGDFGMFSIPTKIAQSILSVTALFIISYYILDPVYNLFLSVNRIGIEAYLTALEMLSVSEVITTLYWILVSIDVVSITLLGSLVFLTFILYFMTIQHTEEDMFAQGLLPMLIYIFWYFLFVGAIWLIVYIDSIKDHLTKGETEWHW
ncbi:MAG: biofilm PGA synthesis N-glycosyltransferase PgaC [Candidatus Nanohaloarchaea archaeon]|jgi:biofilm PGA synthesis N-glycosyltransferase PgaC